MKIYTKIIFDSKNNLLEEEYFTFFLSFYIIIILGFLNGLVGIFGNAFTDSTIFEEMIESLTLQAQEEELSKLN